MCGQNQNLSQYRFSRSKRLVRSMMRDLENMLSVPGVVHLSIEGQLIVSLAVGPFRSRKMEKGLVPVPKPLN